MLEYQLSELAVRRANSAEVKEFAISVLTDHSLALDELREMATRLNVQLPDELSGVHRQHYLSIARKTGSKFEKSYCDFIFLSNTVALKKFEKIVQDGNREEVKDWAWGKVGILKRHISMAESIEGGGSKVANVSL
jgi:putative membrane protein